MSIPNWWEALILALAAFRIWRLLAEDDIMERPRYWITGLGWNWNEGETVPNGYRVRLAYFLQCPWCFGFWISLAWWGVWQVWPHATLVVSVPLAVSAVVGVLGQFIASE